MGGSARCWKPQGPLGHGVVAHALAGQLRLDQLANLGQRSPIQLFVQIVVHALEVFRAQRPLQRQC